MKIKKELHPRNRFREAYDYKALIGSYPELAAYVIKNKYEVESIDFFDPKAVLLLNKALLKHHYQIDHWNIPKGYLCPPIPGRSDYVHIMADLMASYNNQSIPMGSSVKGLDIGVGSAAIYPIIGSREYGWSFVGSDIDNRSIESSRAIVEANSSMLGRIELRLQSNSADIFNGIIRENEYFDFSMCNPPFHRSKEEARSNAKRKLEHLRKKKGTELVLNFGGTNNELWYEGGERAFLATMINQSKAFSNAVFYFSSIVSQEADLKTIYKVLKQVKAHTVKTFPMNTGNKKGRVVAWTFKNKEEQKKWLLNKLK